MRRLPFCACVLTLLAAPAAALAAGPATGGAAAPAFTGDTTHGQPVQKIRRASRKSSMPIVTAFSVAPQALGAGAPATFAFRVDGPMRSVRVRIVLTPAGAVAPAKRLRLGQRGTGVLHAYAWTPAAGEVPAGTYDVALKAFDDAGRAARGALTVSVMPPVIPATTTGVFPVLGPYSFGGDDARFGARRDGHVHQGQDVAAAAGTPLVSPVASSVHSVDFQRNGAGHYVVLRGGDGTDYVFMHLRQGSITTLEGAPLAAGQQFAQVGSSGASSGPHLHFELWPDGWYSSEESKPIDPLPQLLAWAGTR
jgi:murein DD-endopeptidase MepM/ murein hydrolase activator NlpD